LPKNFAMLKVLDRQKQAKIVRNLRLELTNFAFSPENSDG